MNLKNKNSINLLIGLLLILLGFILYLSKSNLWHYLGLLMLIYGLFVTIVKILKIMYLSKGKYKNIWNFEDNEDLNIKGYLKEVLEFRVNNNKEVTFEIPHFGLFSVINYNNGNEDTLSNPKKLKNEINDFIKNEFYPIISFENIVPFATNYSYGTLLIEEKKNEIIYLDLNNSSFKPLILDNKLDFYININKLKLENNKYYYNGLLKLENLVPDTNFFYDIPDCINEGKDYFDMFNKCFSLLDTKIEYSIISIKDFEDKYIFELKVENQIYNTYFKRNSDYIDSSKLVIVLNEILSLIKSNFESKFYLISNQFCDFGIVLANENSYQKLKENGCIALDYKSQTLTEEEENIINKSKVLIREIDNIKYHIEVAKESNTGILKRGEQYHFPYKNLDFLDKDEIKKIEETLNVIVIKAESDYKIFFKN